MAWGGSHLPSFSLPERAWQGLILGSALAVILATYFCLTHGITIVFMHLYYIPIVLLAYHYRRTGFCLAAVLGLSYVGLVWHFYPGDPATLRDAVIRFVVFLGIAGLVSYLAGRLVRAEEATRSYAEIMASSIMNANVLLMILDAKGKILLWNNAAERITGYGASEVTGNHDIWKFLYPEKEYRDAITGRITRIIGEDYFFENLETTIRCRNGDLKTISWNTRMVPETIDQEKRFIAIGVDITERTRAEKALLESEEKYRNLVDRAEDGIAIVQDEVFRYGNPALARIWGGTIEEIIDLPLVAMAHPDAREKIIGRYRKRIAGEDVPGIYETVFLRKDGSQYPAEVNAGAITYRGRPATLTIIRDITERKQTEQALRESEAELADAMDMAHLARWEFDVPTGIFTFNDCFYALYGTTAEREGGYRMPAEVYAREFCHPDDMHMVADEVKKAIDATDPGYVSQLDHRIIRRDGELRYITVRIAITKDAGGNTVKTHGVNQDITERKRMEEALRESEEMFRNPVEHSSVGIYLIQNGLLRYANSRLCEMLGYSCAEILECPIEQFILPEDRTAMMLEFQKSLEGSGGGGHGEFRWVRKDGAVSFLENFGSRMMYHGRPAVFGTIIDVTERKRMEGQIAESLREKEVMLREIHHRVKNNLQILNSLLNLQMEKVPDEKTVMALADTQARVRAMSLVHERLYKTQELSRIDLADYISKLAEELLRSQKVAQKVELDLHIQGTFLDISQAIPVGLIMNEILTNSLKYAFPGGRPGRISISSEKKDGAYLIRISDNGVGIPGDFDWQKSNTLGMRLIHGLVSQVDGTITLDRGHGTSYTIRIPGPRAPLEGEKK